MLKDDLVGHPAAGDRRVPGAVVFCTTLLGWAAGGARVRSGSLIPAIAVHVLFNVSGFIVGVIYTIVTIARTGKPPVM